MSRSFKEGRYQEGKGVISGVHSVDFGFRSMKVTRYLESFGDQSLFEFKRESGRGIRDIISRQYFPEVLLQRAAKILKVVCLHCKNMNKIKAKNYL